jgi:nicotinamidase-related amidase
MQKKNPQNFFCQGTNLESLLRLKGITTVIGVGLLASRCVHSTMHGAFCRGFRTIVLEDCVADKSREKWRMALELGGWVMYEVWDSVDYQNYVKEGEAWVRGG